MHHNNEIAQAEAASGKQPFVKYWMHNAFITIDDNRIGKSQGNSILLSELEGKNINPLALRYLYLTAHYRSPMNFTWEALEGADQALKRLQRAYQAMQGGSVDEKFLQEFYGAVGNDLDTPKALALIWSNLDKLNKATLQEADTVLGLQLAQQREENIPPQVKKLAAEREEARKNKDFAKSDSLRAQIEAAGFDIKDTPEGPQLSKK